MNQSMNWAEQREAKLLGDARLVILKELNADPAGQAGENLIDGALKAFGHRHLREWVRDQLLELEKLGAVKVHKVNDDGFLIAVITKRGIGHLEHLTVIEGITPPSKGV